MLCKKCNFQLPSEMLPEIHQIVCIGELIEKTKIKIEQLDIKKKAKQELWYSQVDILRSMFKKKVWQQGVFDEIDLNQERDNQFNAEIMNQDSFYNEKGNKFSKKCNICQRVFLNVQQYDWHSEQYHQDKKKKKLKKEEDIIIL